MNNSGYKAIYYADGNVIEKTIRNEDGIFCVRNSYTLDNWDFKKDNYKSKKESSKTYDILVRTVDDYYQLLTKLEISNIYSMFVKGDINFYVTNTQRNWFSIVICRLIEYHSTVKNMMFLTRLNWLINKKIKSFKNKASQDYINLYQLINTLENKYEIKF